MCPADGLLERSSRRAKLADCAVLWAAAALVILLRSHVRGAALESDECNYLYIASRMLLGDRLYVDVWDHQPPGVFWMFAALCRVFGDSPATLRWSATAASVLSLVLFFDATRLSFGRRAAWLTAILFAIGHVDPLMAGEGGNREVYMNALAAGAIWMLVRRPIGDTRAALLSGVCWGFMSLLKTVAAAPWLFVTLAVVWLARGGRRLGALAALAVGPALIWAFTFGVYMVTGRLSEFVNAAFRFNLSYSGGGSWFGARFADFFTPPNALVLIGQWPIWVGGLLGIIVCAASGRDMRKPVALWIAYAVGTYVAVCLPGHFWPHYYLLAWPPMVVLTAALCSRVADWLSSGPSMRRVATLLVASPALAVLTWGLFGRYLLVEPTQVSAIRYGQRMEWARQQGERLQSVTTEVDPVYVWGPDVGIYYYGDVVCASRYTMYTPLLPQYAGYEERRQTLLKDLNRSRPVFVFVPEPEFDGLAEFLMKSYYWVGEDRDPEHPEVVRASIFQRKDRFDPDERLPWPRPAPPSD